MTSTPIEWWFGRQWFGVKPGLERIRGLLADLGDPQDAFRTILVAGTNGKGTTASALATCLQSAASGRSPVGLFTSPHLQHVTERFMVQGAEIGEPRLADILQALAPHVERRDATFFEIAVAVAASWFAESGVRTAVFEVGLGGRWDATNALEPVQSVITGIARDHTDILGTDLEGIALEKAGILRHSVPAITGAQGVAAHTIAKEAERLGAPLWRLGDEIQVRGRSLGWSGQVLWIETPLGSLHTTTSLLGAHQQRNLALAAAAASRAGVQAACIETAIPRVQWPGRLERFTSGGRNVVLDGAHNPEAAVALVAAIERLGAVPYTLVVGAGVDKDVVEICAALASGASTTIATRASRSPKASPPGELAAILSRSGIPSEAVEDPGDALARATERTESGGTVLVAGSLYLVGEVRSILTGSELEPHARMQ